MATWNDVVRYVKQRYAIDDERDGALQLIFDLGGGRSQIVTVELAVLRDGAEEWIQISSPIAAVGDVDVDAALRRAGEMVCGGIAIVGDLVVLRHSAPIEHLDVNEFERPLLLVLHSADRLESELVGGDRY